MKIISTHALLLASILMVSAAGAASAASPEMMRMVDEQDLNVLQSALRLYKLDNGRFPSQSQGLAALLTKPTGSPVPAKWKGPYLEKLQNDTHGNPFFYAMDEKTGAATLKALGADGAVGGAGASADLSVAVK